MQIDVLKCQKCGTIKTVWILNEFEGSFFCGCGSPHKMYRYFDSSYGDYFISLLRDPITMESILELAKKEHLHIDPEKLWQQLKAYNLSNLSEQELHEIIMIIAKNHDKFWFRKQLTTFQEDDQMLHAIENLNPRIDIPRLREYLSDLELPLSETEVIQLESVIKEKFYNSEIDTIY